MKYDHKSNLERTEAWWERRKQEKAMAKYWTGDVGEKDDFGHVIKDEIIDAPTKHGSAWALMSPQSWRTHRRTAMLGTGYGQRYMKQEDGKWLKVEG